MFKRLFGRRGPQTIDLTADEPSHPTPALPPEPVAPPETPPSSLRRFRDRTDRVVVVDTETTGVYNSDRVIEVATVTLDLDGRVIDEWDTLIDPGRDVGPTWIHAVTASMLEDAPTFPDVAGDLATRLNGAIVCAHNLPFDSRMLANEYERTNVEVSLTPGLDTLTATGCRLGVACEMSGIQITGAHQALNDARATAQLMLAVAATFDDAAPAQFHTPVPASIGTRRLPRSPGAPQIVAPPTYLAELAARATHQPNEAHVAAYLELLDRAMADLYLEPDELAQLAALAHDLGLDPTATRYAHRLWLEDLINEANADGIVEEHEYDQLLRAAHVLEIDRELVDRRTKAQRTTDQTIVLEAGLGVCFTGVAVDEHGEEIPRDVLQHYARSIGLRVEESFTKSRCGLLVAADPGSSSGKAENARRWGIPVVGASDFLNAAPGDALTSRVIVVRGLQAHTCANCGRAFTRLKKQGIRGKLCDDCTALPAAAAPAARPQRTATPGTPGIEELTCMACGDTYQRAITRGRKPSRCPSCRTGSPATT